MNNTVRNAARGLTIGVLLCAAPGAFADATKKDSAGAKDSAADQAADNTGRNRPERKDGEPTAEQQQNNKSDLEITRQIRRAVVTDKSLSISAHNVKIITQDGKVTLKGPVRSEDEKQTVEKKAIEVAGKANVKCDLEVAAKK